MVDRLCYNVCGTLTALIGVILVFISLGTSEWVTRDVVRGTEFTRVISNSKVGLFSACYKYGANDEQCYKIDADCKLNLNTGEENPNDAVFSDCNRFNAVRGFCILCAGILSVTLIINVLLLCEFCTENGPVYTGVMNSFGVLFGIIAMGIMSTEKDDSAPSKSDDVGIRSVSSNFGYSFALFCLGAVMCAFTALMSCMLSYATTDEKSDVANATEGAALLAQPGAAKAPAAGAAVQMAAKPKPAAAANGAAPAAGARPAANGAGTGAAVSAAVAAAAASKPKVPVKAPIKKAEPAPGTAGFSVTDEEVPLAPKPVVRVPTFVDAPLPDLADGEQGFTVNKAILQQSSSRVNLLSKQVPSSDGEERKEGGVARSSSMDGVAIAIVPSANAPGQSPVVDVTAASAGMAGAVSSDAPPVTPNNAGAAGGDNRSEHAGDLEAPGSSPNEPNGSGAAPGTQGAASADDANEDSTAEAGKSKGWLGGWFY